MPAWEAVAVAFAVAYLLLAAREHIACWACALASTAIYTVLFWGVNLPLQSALNVFYMGMAVYGAWQWRYGGAAAQGVAIHTLPVRRHAALLALIGLLAAASGWLLDQWQAPVWPYLDAAITWGSVLTTVLVARKVLENWIYWFAIDAAAIPLYVKQGLYLTALLFAAYLIIVVFGYFSWRRRMTS